MTGRMANRLARFGLTCALVALAWLSVDPRLAARAQEVRPRIAVLDFQGTGVEAAEVIATADRIRVELVKREKFTVLERAQSEAILGELAFQQEGVTDPAQAAKFGKLLNVEFVVTGRVTRIDDALQINVQMIRIETGEIVRAESLTHRGDFISLLDVQVPVIAARLAQVEPPPAPLAVSPPPPEPAQEPSRPWRPMGMMFGGGAGWALPAGGMIVMASVMMGSRLDESDRGAAYAVGAVGVGLLLYYLLSDEPEPAAALVPEPPAAAWRSGPESLARGFARIGLGWRW
jgi:TolB-like protein